MPALPRSTPTSLEAWRAEAARHRRRVRFVALPNLEVLTVVLALGTALAISPVGRSVDQLFFVRVLTRDDGWVFIIASDVLDRLSSQRVVGVLLGVTATWFAVRGRSFVPLIVAGLAEAMFAAVGVLKVAFGKSATRLGEPLWWDDGILAHGKYSMAYPSGHATEAVVLWGAIVLLLVMHAPGWRHRHTLVATRIWHVIALNTVVVSWLLGRHWVSDLAAGLVCGAIGLRLVVGLVERGYPQAVDARLRAWLVRVRTHLPPAHATRRSVRGGATDRPT